MCSGGTKLIACSGAGRSDGCSGRYEVADRSSVAILATPKAAPDTGTLRAPPITPAFTLSNHPEPLMLPLPLRHPTKPPPPPSLSQLLDSWESVHSLAPPTAHPPTNPSQVAASPQSNCIHACDHLLRCAPTANARIELAPGALQSVGQAASCTGGACDRPCTATSPALRSCD